MLRIAALLAAAVVCALAVACAGSDDGSAGGVSGPTSSSSPTAVPETVCTPSLPHEPAVTHDAIDVGGLTRTYTLRVPPAYDGAARTPLVFAFHGLAQTAQGLGDYTRIGAATDSAGYIAVIPDGTGAIQHWNMRRTPGDADDVAFVDALLTKVSADLCVDADRVYAAGYSNGGGMAQALACALPKRIAAVAVVASSWVPCRANVPLIAFHGIDDRIVPYAGGQTPPELGSIVFPPVRRSISGWAGESGCDTLATIARLSTEVELSNFGNCSGASEVLLYTILGGGHTWPGATPLDFLGYTTEQIDASQRMLEFFSTHTAAEAR